MTGSTDVITGYIRFFETLTPETLGDLDLYVSSAVRFRDPFNDVIGVDAMRAILAKMFVDVSKPKFVVTDAAVGGEATYLRWIFTFQPRSGAAWTIEGVSELHIADGKIVAHLDHWDSGAQFYARLPGVGPLVRWIARRVSG